MRTRILIIALIVAMGLSVSALGQALDNLNLVGHGARAKAMGGAFISVADDGSALSWNPAGLIQVQDPQLSFAIDYFRPKTNFDLSYSDSRGLDKSKTVSFEDDLFPFSFASFAAPVQIRDHLYVLSASFSSVSTRYDYFEANIDPDTALYLRQVIDMGLLDTVAVNFQERADCRLNLLRLGFGTNLYKNLNAGAGIDIFFGKGYIDTLFQYNTSYIHPEQDTIVDVLYHGNVADTLTFTGLNFIGGMMWRDDKFSIGGTIRLPFWITQKHVNWAADTIWQNGVAKRASLADIDETDKERFQVPWTLGLGASYNISESFLLASDFEWRRFGKSYTRYHYDTLLSSGDQEEIYYEYWMRYRNGYQVRIGAEYVMDMDFATIPLRAGFRYESFGHRDVDSMRFQLVDFDGIESNVQKDSLLQYRLLGDQRVGYGLAFGFGLHWELVKLDFSMEYDMRDKKASGTDYYGHFDAVGEYRGMRISMNFTGLFK